MQEKDDFFIKAELLRDERESYNHADSVCNPSATTAPKRSLPAPCPLHGDALSLRGSYLYVG